MKLKPFYVNVPDLFRNTSVDAYEHEDAAILAVELFDEELSLAADQREVVVFVTDEEGQKKKFRVSGCMEPNYYATEDKQTNNQKEKAQ